MQGAPYIYTNLNSGLQKKEKEADKKVEAPKQKVSSASIFTAFFQTVLCLRRP
jgi:hypothetical protein